MATKKVISARKAASSTGRRPKRTLRSQPRLLAVAVGAALFPSTFFSTALADPATTALPTGGQVTSGTATLTYAPNKLQIDQGTNKAIFQWDNFSIGSSAWVNFNQPSSSSVALNRVAGTNPSEIFGRLTANGQVFLSNPNGVLFAPGASVDVGGLFATTLSIADRDFLAGRYNFYNAGGAGSVINQGVITATGYASLAGPTVRNDGIIVAHAGTVALAAGDRVTLDMIGDGLIKVSVDQAALNASAINTGRIEADGGNVILTARSANALLDTVINNSGIIRANSLVERNGEIVLDGGSTGTVANSGTMQAAGVEAGTTGGTVKVLGDKVALLGGTRIDASGDAGGGTVLVGGNFHGAGPEQNASTTTIEASVTINADAITSGNGGNIAVWSDRQTTVGGALTARGGLNSGNGGFVETSGKQLKIADGTSVKTSAPNGQAGNWLLDPVDFVIAAAGGDITGSTLATNLGSGNVKIRSSDGTVGGTNGDILVQDSVTWTSTNTLELSAFRNVTFNASGVLTATGGPGNVILRADNTGTGTGTVTVGLGGGSINAGVVTVYYNPASYAVLTDYGTGQGITATTVNSHAWIFLSGAAVSNKTYDATTAATIGTQASFAGDPTALGVNAVTLNTAGATANFSDKNAGVGKTVNLLGYTLTGADAPKFAIFDNAGTFAAPGAAATFQTTTTANIDPAIVNLAGSRAYDTTTTFAANTFGTAGTVTGVGGETLVLTGSGSVASAHVAAGSQSLALGTLTLTNGTGLASNYTLTGGTDTGTVTVAPLSFTGTKVYDTTTTFAANTFGTAGTVTGVGGETLVLTGSGSVASAHVAAGSQPVTLGTLAITSGTGAATDYTFAGGTQTASVTAKAVNLAATRVYDGSLNFTAGALTSYTITGTVGGETLVLASGTGTVPSKDVSAGAQTLTPGTLALGSGTGTASDYTLVGGTNTGAITQLASVTWTGGGGNNLWSNAANWGGAIPDKNNVANVNLGGASVVFDNAVPSLAGSVQLTSLSGGALTVNSGTLQVATSASLTGYSQTSGTTMSGTTFSSTGGYTQSGGLTQVGSTLSLSGGPINQTGGSLTVGSSSTINAGASAITLTSGSNDFVGAVSLTGGTTQITDGNSLTLGSLSTGSLTATSGSGLNLGSGTVSGNLTASTNGTLTESGPLNVSGTSNLQAGGGTISLTSANTLTGAITASGSNVFITDTTVLTPSSITASGAVGLTANGFATTGSISGASATFSSATDVGSGGSSLAINFGFGSVVLTGTASTWNLAGPAVPQPLFTPSSQSTGANVFYNNGCISGPACAGVFSVTASIGASVSQIASQALKDAQSTDSVAKQIDYGFAGDVGTTPPMDHRIDETGISTPSCFEESREGTACK